MIAGRAANYTSTDPTQNPPVVEGQANPMRRDTIFIEAGASATLRFVADNPGVWFMHCKFCVLHFLLASLILFLLGHIEWHLEAGLVIEFIEAPLTIQEHNGVPQFMYDQCRTDGTPYSGNAAGHASTTNLSGLPLGPYPVS